MRAVLKGAVARKAVVYPLLLMMVQGPQVAASWLTLWQGMRSQPVIASPTRVAVALPLVTERKWAERSQDERKAGSAQ